MNYTKFMEALKGKQKKLDKNHNGELDKKDFEMLRKEETEQLEEGLDPSEVAGNPRMYSADTVKKAFYHKKASAGDKESLARHLDRHHGNKDWRKSVKEEVEDLDEAVSVKKQDYSWGKMVTVHHGADTSYPLHPEHQAAIKKLNDGEKTSFKDETNRKVNAHREGDNVHLSSDRTGKKTTVAHSHFAEEANHAPVAPTLDRKYIKGTPENKALKASRKPINGHPTNKMKEEVELDEKLDPSMGAGEYIKDFQKSDAPQFAGKSKEKRRVMGIAAYLGAKRDVKEAVSPVSVKVNHALEEPHEEEWEDTGICPEHNKKDCHQCGKAGMKEQVEEIQEKSDQAKQNKTMKNLMAASKGAKLNRDSGLKLTPGDTGHSNAQQMNKALGRHAMRENEGLKSYKEFMMMLEYESDKSGSYTHKGSYGSEFAKKEREKDEKGFDSENEPAKRGPKMGSKRGPKANLGSSKLHTK